MKSKLHSHQSPWAILLALIFACFLTAAFAAERTPRDHPIYRTHFLEWQTLEPSLPTFSFKYQDGLIVIPKVDGVWLQIRNLYPDMLHTFWFRLESTSGHLLTWQDVPNKERIEVRFECGQACGHELPAAGYASLPELNERLQASFSNLRPLFSHMPEGVSRTELPTLSRQNRMVKFPCTNKSKNLWNFHQCDIYFLNSILEENFSYTLCRSIVGVNYADEPFVAPKISCVLFYRYEGSRLSLIFDLENPYVSVIPEYELIKMRNEYAQWMIRDLALPILESFIVREGAGVAEERTAGD